MEHERAFLQAIREEPDDDAHRLICADWLEEQGGAERTARSAFIRAQCRLAALPCGDPGRADLEDEAADLLAEHEREWTLPLHGIAEDWRFARGFLESITLRGEDFLTHAERLFDFAPLRAVHLLIHGRDIPRLAACPQLQYVETLDFRRCHLNDRALQQLLTSPYLTSLKALNLDGVGINTPGMQALASSPVLGRLQRLDLRRNPGIGERGVRLLAQASSLENLNELSLALTNATPAGLRALFHSSRLPRLKNLNICGIRFDYPQLTSPLTILVESGLLEQLHSLDASRTINASGLAILLASPVAANLRTLILRSVGLAGGDVAPLAEAHYLTNLAYLDLRGNRLGDEGVRQLADSPFLVSLDHLDVSWNNVRDAGAQAIGTSAHLRNLTVLDLAGNGIGGPGLQALAIASNLGRLRVLNIASNFIGADSVRALAESPHLARLAQLDLSDASLGEDSARALAGSATLNRLRKLLLPKNQLGDGGARALAQSPHLKQLITLDLHENRIGKAGAEAFAAAPHGRRLRRLDLRGNVFTDTQEALLRDRFGDAVLL